jgi:hypothetical protein
VHSIAAGIFASRDQIHFFEEIGYEHNPYTHCPKDPGMWERGKCGCDPGRSFGASFLVLCLPTSLPLPIIVYFPLLTYFRLYLLSHFPLPSLPPLTFLLLFSLLAPLPFPSFCLPCLLYLSYILDLTLTLVNADYDGYSCMRQWDKFIGN